jgi:AAA+ superfamily predicted ATPase
MCDLTTRVQRAVQARVPLQIVTTSDVAGATGEIQLFLRDSLHMLTVWNPVLGHRKSEIVNETLNYEAKWDGSTAANPLGILDHWVATQHSTENKTYWRTKDDQGLWKFRALRSGDSIDDYDGNHKRVHESLVLVGLEPWLDVHSHHYDPMTEQTVWELSNLAKEYLINLILVLPHSTKLSPKLTNAAAMLEDKLPNRDWLAHKWEVFLEGVPPSYLNRIGIPTRSQGSSADAVAEFAVRAVDRLCGLTKPGVDLALTRALIDAASSKSDERHEVFLEKLAAAKAEAIRRSSALEIIKSMSLSDVGGLDHLKLWIEDSKVTFTPEARAAGIAPAKGVLLVGPPGTGKSISAKALAGYLGFPLISFDMGSVYGSLVGDSEKNMRTALATLEAAAPCVVLIDEFEKGMAGSKGTSTDGGTSQRVYGTLLTWMQERDTTNPVVVVATANDITRLDEAILRKGRFDEIFWVDLPNMEERAEILQVHLNQVPDTRLAWPKDEAPIATSGILEASEGFVGAEIAQAIKEANIKSFRDDALLSITYIINAMRETRPLSVTMKESMQRSREWAKDRLRPATLPQTQTQKGFNQSPAFGNVGEV